MIDTSRPIRSFPHLFELPGSHYFRFERWVSRKYQAAAQDWGIYEVSRTSAPRTFFELCAIECDALNDAAGRSGYYEAAEYSGERRDDYKTEFFVAFAIRNPEAEALDGPDWEILSQEHRNGLRAELALDARLGK